MASKPPTQLHTTRSFTRMDSAPEVTSPRKRASTFQTPGITAPPEARRLDTALDSSTAHIDVFENPSHEEEDVTRGVQDGTTTGTSTFLNDPKLHSTTTFADLPIEIRSLTERFLESLNAKVHPTPLSAEALSDLFQDFYDRAAAQIATHIATLSSRIGRESSPAAQDRARGPTKGRSRAGSGAKKSVGSPSGGEMLTPTEIASRRKARKLLERKGVALEEAVERSVCERIYARIWKHRSTDDDARDEKLRSRTAALAVVGIGLKELRVDATAGEGGVDVTDGKESDIHKSLAPAREALARMNEEHYPLGKLQHLTAAHKSIVETLSELFPSSSSADEILPTLIYTLITSPPGGMDVVSNLNFIQRFRAAFKVDGEAAYCMVNLEAAISFLETVDLSSLRADELPGGPPKIVSGPSTPTTETPTAMSTSPPKPTTASLEPPQTDITPAAAVSATASQSAASALSNTQEQNLSSRPAMQARRISTLIQTQTDRLEAGRDQFLNTADKVYDSVNGTLENSLQFVFGRFKEQQIGSGIAVPRTLAEARRLVSSPARMEDGEDVGGEGRISPQSLTGGVGGDRVVDLLGGKRVPYAKEANVESIRSGGSAHGKRVANPGDIRPNASTERGLSQAQQGAGMGGTLFGSMNPLKFNVPGFARFGKPGTVASPSIEKTGRLGDAVDKAGMPRKMASKESLQSAASGPLEGSAASDHGAAETNIGEDNDHNAGNALAQLRQLKPPRKRFLEVQSADELRIGEVEELLNEYRRLARAIGRAVAN